jgi:mono/diheme cytochrome c family protein
MFVPLPNQYRVKQDKYYLINPLTFAVNLTTHTHQRVTNSIRRIPSMNYAKNILVTLSLIAVAFLQFGCGNENGESGEGGASSPAFKLTASSISSQADASAHTHVVTIPFIDVSASPAADIFQYRSTTSSGHSHVIALSKQQMVDLSNGMRLVLVCSAPNTGSTHTHTWNVQGGILLYDKNCYNCHGNANRGRNPMNVAFNVDQISAEISPGTAPLSTSTAAIPNPNYTASTSLPLDGAALYTANCSTASCHHGPLATSTKQNSTFTQIKTAIANNYGGMASLGGLTDAQLKAIATALVK